MSRFFEAAPVGAEAASVVAAADEAGELEVERDEVDRELLLVAVLELLPLALEAEEAVVDALLAEEDIDLTVFEDSTTN